MILRLILTLVAFAGLSIALEYYFYRCAIHLLGKKNWLKWILVSLQSVVTMTWVAVVILFTTQSNADQSLISSLFIILLGNTLQKVIFALLSLLRYMLPSHIRAVLSFSFICSFSIWVVFGYGIHNANYPQTKQIELKFSNLPPAFDGYKIALISDTHLGTMGAHGKLLKRAAHIIQNEDPDILLHAGDWISLNANETNPHIGVFTHVSPHDGKFTVMGNHDYSSYARGIDNEERLQQVEQLKTYVSNEGFRWLDDSSHVIHRGNDSITLIGVQNWGESRMGKHGDLKKAMKYVTTSNEEFKMLLSHNPEHFRSEVAQQFPIDLTMSGHTHAMQLVLKLGKNRFSPSQWIYPYWSGVYKQNERTLVVSEGLGCSLYYMRIGTPAEIMIITLRGSKNKQ